MQQQHHAAEKDTIQEIAELLPGTQPVAERVKSIVQQTRFQGPIPHPDIFKGYGDVVSDAPERILKVFEDDSRHARDIQFEALRKQAADNRRVHWMAWSVIAGGYLLSVVFAAMNKDLLAGGVLTTTLAGTIAAFFKQIMPSKDSKDD